MEDDFDLTLEKVLNCITAGFGLIAVLALIWAQWLLLRICLTVVVLSFVVSLVVPDDL